MPKIYKDGTDQYLLFRASKDDYSGAFTGASDGSALQGAVVVISEYKKPDETIVNPSVTWNATIGKWKVVIPASYITQYGFGELNISGTGMIPVSIEFEAVSDVDFNNSIVEGTFTRLEIERMIAAVLIGNETREIGVSTFMGIDGSTPRVIASLNTSGRTITTRNGSE